MPQSNPGEAARTSSSPTSSEDSKPTTFSHEAWDRLLSQTIDQINTLAEVKGGEYAGDEDRLANFRRNAAAVGLPMEVVWRIYAGKHWDSITQYVRDLASGVERPHAEPMMGRADDLIVYAILFKAMLMERGQT